MAGETENRWKRTKRQNKGAIFIFLGGGPQFCESEKILQRRRALNFFAASGSEKADFWGGAL